MKDIRITRDANDSVIFEEVVINNTEMVFFINDDPKEAHFPTIADNPIAAASPLPSSQCIPQPSYGCRIDGHENEAGTIHIVDPLEATNTTLQQATQGQPINEQQVVTGGKSPYRITQEVFEVRDSNEVVIQSGSGIGPNLTLIATSDDSGIKVRGIPTLSGVYHFTFTVDDAARGNLQQVQYSMVVV